MEMLSGSSTSGPLPRAILCRQALRKTRIGFPNILDVYSVGQLPMVRLVACESSSLPHVGWAYRPGDAREDIDLKMVETIYRALMDGPRPQRST